jgi:hypothetical protein
LGGSRRVALVTAYRNKQGKFTPQDTKDTAMPIQQKASNILHVMHTLMEAASRKGFYLKRWTKVVNVMIYKSPRCTELEKLGIIHLFEADFNLIIGLLFGRRAMYHTAENRWIHREQYCKPARKCNDAVMLKILHNHIAHITKTPMG